MTVRAWTVLGAVAFGNLVVAALHFGLAAAGPELRSALDIDTAQLGLVLATPALGLMLGTYAWGVLSDATSERLVLAGAFAGFAAAVAVAAEFASHAAPVGFGIALLVSGACGSAAHSAGGRAISGAFPEHRHGLVLSIRHVAIPIGAAIGGLLVPRLVHLDGLATAIAWFAAAGVVASLLLAALVPSARRMAAEHDPAEAARGASPLRLRRMWLLAVGAGSLAFVQLGIGSFLTLQVVDRAGVALAAAAGLYTAAQLLGACGRIGLGVWSDRVASRTALLQLVAAGATVFVLASLAPIPTVGAIVLQAAALVVVTSCNGVVVAIAASFAPPGRTGATLGMQTTANAAACALAPILLGVVLEHGGWTPYAAVLACVLVMSLGTLGLLRREIAGNPAPTDVPGPDGASLAS